MLNWGILGAGGIATVFCNAIRFSKTGQLIAIASRSLEKAKRLALDFSIPKCSSSYEDLLKDKEVQAVYISTIHPTHAEWAIKAAQAGKHILVEKPIAMNYFEARAMIDSARENDVFLMEAFMYRCHPQIRKMVELIQNGVIGKVQLIRSVFGYHAEFDPSSRVYSNKLGGGGILDVGCYPASFVRLVAGAAVGKSFLDPMQVKACGVVGPTGVDHYTAATLQFESDIIAEIITSIGCQLPVQATVYGADGMITVPNPWLPSTPCRFATKPLSLDTRFPSEMLLVEKYESGKIDEIIIEADRDLFTYEVDTVAAHISERQAPAMSWDDTLGNMRLLDRWRKEIGVMYQQDRRKYE